MLTITLPPSRNFRALQVVSHDHNDDPALIRQAVVRRISQETVSAVVDKLMTETVDHHARCTEYRLDAFVITASEYESLLRDAYEQGLRDGVR